MEVLVVLVFVTLTVISTAFGAVSEDGGVTSCEDTGLNWYEKAVGETPCKTYERLRQICNRDFRVPDMRKDLNVDRCSDQLASCCCNTIAYSLRMLCYTCQRGMGKLSYGMDVKPGTYQIYLESENKTCPNESRRRLLNEVQSAVCNSGIKIFEGLYNRTVWDDGSFYFVYTRDELTKESITQGDGAFVCKNPSTSLSSITLATSTSPPTSPLTSQTLSKGVIAGICVLIIGITLTLWFIYEVRRRKRRSQKGETDQTYDDRPNQVEPYVSPDVPPRRNKHEAPNLFNHAPVPETPPPSYRKLPN
ncbi:hypothetical protein PQX77_007626 [Marasmius sp. AFHP31]|nr:hypothetical protein PQX77_007626 [Marasmius sp. AFHP31]